MQPLITVITGAASGIGLAIARRFAGGDHRLVLIDRSPAVQQVATEISENGGTAAGYVTDVADGQALRRTMDAIHAEYGRCDILVNNAGIHPKHADGSHFKIPEISSQQWDQVMAVNLTAPFLLSAWALELMKPGGWGRIVNISSRAGRIYSDVAGAHYSASKAGLIGFTRVLAGEGGPYGVTANCVAPGRIKTPLSDQGGEQLGLHGRFADMVPLRRIGTPTELAAAVAFLASYEASFVTGAVIDVNGGQFG
jgi:3-oxoacyl-[acyl-carrier protein] reductase